MFILGRRILKMKYIRKYIKDVELNGKILSSEFYVYFQDQLYLNDDVPLKKFGNKLVISYTFDEKQTIEKISKKKKRKKNG